jgi:glycosyltransferase involved in cell wall biosynthesis
MLIGDGELEKAVKTFVDTNSLHGQFLLRAASSPFMEHEYREASLYVMTSRNECLPMTLLEALQQGLPCISFDCETGPRFIIQHRKNGMLVEKDNVSAMVAAIQQLIDDEGLRQRQAAYAPASLEVFSEAAALTNWRLLINP